MDENLAKSLSACDKAKDSDLIFFPEIQLSPFFPQYEKRNASKYLVTMDSPYVKAFIDKAKEINSRSYLICILTLAINVMIARLPPLVQQR